MVRNVVAYCSDGKRKTEITLEQISDVLAVDDASFVWVGLYEPDEPLLLKMQEEFCLHPLAVEDALKAHQRPKIELYGDSLFMVLHTAQVVSGHIEFGETHIFIGPRYLLTVRHGASLTFSPARERCEKSPNLMKLGPSYGLYSVLDAVVDNYFPIVNEFQEELNELEKDIFAEDYRRETVRRLYELKRDLTQLRLAASPMQDMLNQLMQFHPTLIRKEVRVYLRDVHDHVVRVNEAVDTMREMLTAAMSVNLSLVTVAQGEIVKRLAGWASLLAAPTLLTSWYGMNFHHMPELDEPYGYLAMIAITLGICVVLYFALRRAKWL
ncbi:MAG TPA: magnesium/cobalt transporter CorA [Arenimonas sp.]|nr:magnesium/cobalt transporter CorA [Arenimonas sp.]HMB55945.1 magnesium/cobalt transporter CorA [Arenimonas sp.]